MKFVFTFFGLFITSFAFSQNVQTIKYDQLEKRLTVENDTTYIFNFWATWCSPCVKELPHFVELQQEFKNDKLKVVLVSMDFKSKLQTSVEPFVKKSKLPLEVLLLDEKDLGSVIDKIDSNWSGALPGTLIVNNKRALRKFFEREFTYEELKQTYLITKN